MDFSDFVTWAFLGMTSFTAIRVVNFLDKTNQSIEKLNLKIALVIEKLETHEERIAKLEDNKWEHR